MSDEKQVTAFGQSWSISVVDMENAVWMYNLTPAATDPFAKDDDVVMQAGNLLTGQVIEISKRRLREIIERARDASQKESSEPQ